MLIFPFLSNHLKYMVVDALCIFRPEPPGEICKIVVDDMEGEFVLKYDPELDDIIQVA